MNRVDVVDLVVDLVDLDLDVDLVDVDLAVSLCDGPRSVLFSFGLVAPTCFICFWPRRELIFRGLVRQFRQYYFPAVFPASLYTIFGCETFGSVYYMKTLEGYMISGSENPVSV